jgi:hypothetical protein
MKDSPPYGRTPLVRPRGRHRSPKRRFYALYAALAAVVAMGTYAVDAHGGAAQAAVTGRAPAGSGQHAAPARPLPPMPAAAVHLPRGLSAGSP